MGLKDMIDGFANKLNRRRNLNALFDSEAERILNRNLDICFGMNLFLQNCAVGENILANMSKATSYGDKAKVVEAAFCPDSFWEMVNPLYDDLKKSDGIANALKRKGDRFKNQIPAANQKAFQCYGLAVQFACPENQVIVNIYWESFLLALRLYPHSGETMKLHEAAKECKQFESYRYKFAKQRCRHEEFYGTEPTSTSEEENPKLTKYAKKTIFKVFGESSESTLEMGSCVVVRDSPTHGKGSFANEILDPGTTVIVDRPYVTSSVSCFIWDARYCFRCFKPLLSCVPCNNCVFYVYCSAECRDTDYKDGHKYECPCLPYIFALKNREAYQLSLKAICKAGPKTLSSAYIAIMDDPSSVDNRTVSVLNSDGEIDKYSKIVNLWSHPQRDEVNACVWMAYTIAEVLRHKSDFFNEYDETIQPVMTQFLTSAIVHHLFSFRYNTFCISAAVRVDTKLPNDKSETLQSSKFGVVGTGVYPTANKINHSCDGNVIMQQAPDGTLAMITNRRLITGNQLFFSYGPIYTEMKRERRRKHMKEGYLFDCDCPACSWDWPTFNRLQKLEKKILCPDCSDGTLEQNIEINNYVLEADGYNEDGTCRVCGETFAIGNLRKDVRRHDEFLRSARELLHLNKPLDALPIIKMCISFYQRTLCPPSAGLAMSQRLLCRALSLVVRPNEWILNLGDN